MRRCDANFWFIHVVTWVVRIVTNVTICKNYQSLVELTIFWYTGPTTSIGRPLIIEIVLILLYSKNMKLLLLNKQELSQAQLLFTFCFLLFFYNAKISGHDNHSISRLNNNVWFIYFTYSGLNFLLLIKTLNQ